MVEGDRGTCAIVATRSFCYWPQILVYSGVKKSGKLSLTTPTGCLHIILNSTVEETQGLDLGLTKSIARGKPKGRHVHE
jgi:hypothetical protein